MFCIYRLVVPCTAIIEQRYPITPATHYAKGKEHVADSQQVILSYITYHRHSSKLFTQFKHVNV